jgi:hypothetical protein
MRDRLPRDARRRAAVVVRRPARPHFLDHDDQLVLLVEALSVLRRRRVTGTMITIDRNIEEEPSR